MSHGFSFRLEDSPDPADVQAIRDGLEAFNLRHAPHHGYRQLHVMLRDEGGRLVGGLLGVIYWGWLYVDTLWLADEARGGGYGSAMLAAAEDEARRHGCRHAHLDTMDWQALPFYLKHGYTEWGRLDDFADGRTRFFLKKDL